MDIRCPQCYMPFTSIGQLSMHRSRFCVGLNRDTRTEKTPVTDYRKGQSTLAERKIDEILDWKANRRSREENRGQQLPRLTPNMLSHNQSGQNAENQNLHGSALDRNSPSDQRKKELQNLNMEHGEQLKALHSQRLVLEMQKQLIDMKMAKLLEERHDAKAYKDAENQLLPSDPKRGKDGMGVQGSQKSIVHPFSWTGGSVASDAKALFDYYVSTNGRDPVVLQQLADLMEEAGTLSDQKNDQVSKDRLSEKDLRDARNVLNLEKENIRLQKEIHLLEQRPSDVYPDDIEDLRQQMMLLQQENREKIARLEQQLNSATRQVEPEIGAWDPRDVQSPRGGPLVKGMDHETLSFTCFYDFIIGLDISTKLVKVVVSFYSDSAELGAPSSLPVIQCEPFDRQLNAAMIGARQDIPRCPATNGFCLVIELQASSTTVESRLTRAWAKISLLDHNMALLSGSWKVLFRVLPVRPLLSNEELASLPQYHEAIMYLRIVPRDEAAAQSRLRLSLADRGSYRKPEQMPASDNRVSEWKPYSWVT